MSGFDVTSVIEVAILVAIVGAVVIYARKSSADKAKIGQQATEAVAALKATAEQAIDRLHQSVPVRNPPPAAPQPATPPQPAPAPVTPTAQPIAAPAPIPAAVPDPGQGGHTWAEVGAKIAAQNQNVSTPYVAPPTPPAPIPTPTYPPLPADPRDMSYADTKANYDALLSQSADAAKNYAMSFTNWYRELGLTPQEINSYSPGNGTYFGELGSKFCAISGSQFAMKMPDETVRYFTLAVPVAENPYSMQMLTMKRGG